MIMITASQVKNLREKTGAGMMQCKEALTATSGNEAEALIWLRQKGIAIADGKVGRPTTEGTIGSYIHTGGRIGVMVEILCETDFVARSDEFQELVRNIGMQIAACPTVAYVSIDQVPDSVVEVETNIEMGKNDLSNKPENIRAKIVEGRIAKRLKEFCLMDQNYIKDGSVTVQDYIKMTAGKFGENINVKKFVRFNLGE
jgi:elongation factor Ts